MTRRRARLLACGVAGVLAGAAMTPPMLRAQEPGAGPAAGSAARDSALLASLALLRSRERLLVNTGGRLVAGRYLGHDADTLWLRVRDYAGGATPLEHVRALYVQRGTHAPAFGFLGALLAGGAGWTLGGPICTDGTSGGDCRFRVTVFGAGVGLVAGALVGAVMPRWVRRYPPARARGDGR